MRGTPASLRRLAETLEHAARGLKNVAKELEPLGPGEQSAQGLAEMKAASAPEGDFWCMSDHGSGRPIFATANTAAILNPDGTWEDATDGNPRRYVGYCKQGFAHTITKEEALATLEYPIRTGKAGHHVRIYSGPSDTGIYYNTRSLRHGVGAIALGYALGLVRDGSNDILTAAEAEAIVKPKHSLRVAIDEYKRLMGDHCHTIEQMTARQGVCDALARDKGEL